LWMAPFLYETYCNTLQHTATHCNILQHTAMQISHWNTSKKSVLQCVALHSKENLCVALCCRWHLIYKKLTATYLPLTATHCNTLQHTATHCYADFTLEYKKRMCIARECCRLHLNYKKNTPAHCNTLQHTALQISRCNCWYPFI